MMMMITTSSANPQSLQTSQDSPRLFRRFRERRSRWHRRERRLRRSIRRITNLKERHSQNWISPSLRLHHHHQFLHHRKRSLFRRNLKNGPLNPAEERERLSKKSRRLWLIFRRIWISASSARKRQPTSPSQRFQTRMTSLLLTWPGKSRRRSSRDWHNKLNKMMLAATDLRMS